MRFGIGTSLDNVNRLAAAGYDFIEVGVRRVLIPEADEAEFGKIRVQVERAPIKPECFAGFIPGELRVVGDSVDFPRLSRYVKMACRRAEELGGKIIVYGSFASRNVEPGYSHEKALDQIAEFLDMAADHAEAHGITIALEAVSHLEGNIIRTLPQAAEMLQRVNRDGVRLVADIYHIWHENEPMQHIIDAAEWLAYVHIAEPVKRGYPGNDDFDFTDFFAALKAVGYDGRVSCECRFDDFDRDIETTLRTLKAYV
jgi:sugar phosphate isomerase/epimerase